MRTKDNQGKPRQLYYDKIEKKSDDELFEECKSMIWLSAFASNNPRSDYHWQVYGCYDECKKRNKIEIYTKAHKAVSEGV